MTDDQGYGDLGCHGNPIVQTPTIDRFYQNAVRLTDFHVGPTCSPTRAGLMTGRSANRTGVWHTIGGCSILRKEETTVAQLFQQEGYETGIFGKWHLGDTYPARPEDKGFTHTVIHKGGGVGQSPDYWGNDYFDDSYFVNGLVKKFKGYCTDVWFDEAIDYITRVKDKPFFCYISTNAPHSPFNVPAEYYEPYKEYDIPESQKRFYGMISNIDDNFEKLQSALDRLDLTNNTILIFMTDNGTSMGYKQIDGKWVGYNAGMKGTKNSEYEGGHRVPFFISYPNGNIGGGKDVSTLTANVDLLPTLTNLCGLKLPNRQLDGLDITPILTGEKKQLNRDYLITDSQRLQEPQKWKKSAVMSGTWRLVNGKELYDIASDLKQDKDLAAVHPQKVSTLRGYYEEWWTSVSEQFSEYPTINVGTSYENPVTIASHDAHVEVTTNPWHQNHVLEGKKNPLGGVFIIDFENSGNYELAISRWPFESDLAINVGVADERKATIYTDSIPAGKAHNFVSGGVKVGGWKQEASIKEGATELSFKGYFPKGLKNVEAWFTNSENNNWGAYFLRITKLENSKS